MFIIYLGCLTNLTKTSLYGAFIKRVHGSTATKASSSVRSFNANNLPFVLYNLNFKIIQLINN